MSSSAAQNIYDTEDFFHNYAQLPRMKQGLAGASEWPLLYRMLPPVAGRRVLDLGCGDGILSLWAASEGAAQVNAYDISVNMLQRAREKAEALFAAGDDNRNKNKKPPVFARMDLEDVNLDMPDGSVDVCISGLALHYVSNFDALLSRVFRAMKPGGSFVFSIEHPMYTAPVVPGFRPMVQDAAAADAAVSSQNATGSSSGQGSAAQDSGSKFFWPVDSYFSEGQREVTWLNGGVQKQHRTMASYFNMLVAAGFVVKDMAEWGSTEDARRKHPDWPENVCPRFLLLAAQKPAAVEEPASTPARL
ncbi:hypothetical protein MCOR02_007241 [Pyricularia oryzae]|nr:hypothetical protein MCOR02_007241 [Pyricularia oryzae]KAI6319383.1 hypothetical protein MCOR34_003249 [Pyricularia oryzae]KAI6476811.1 hypothetical protein MCOR17_000836 [Pyricularia oryzae]KAI6512338.1 hypothetical protein MCOR13_000138 [Pyricularia oryzae]KAI6558179.1 hypothetical protein MCOR04_010022 [Pyricularia oryzae]